MKTFIYLTRSIITKDDQEIHTTIWVESPIKTKAINFCELDQKKQRLFIKWMEKYYPTFQIVGFKQETELSQ